MESASVSNEQQRCKMASGEPVATVPAARHIESWTKFVARVAVIVV